MFSTILQKGKFSGYMFAHSATRSFQKGLYLKKRICSALVIFVCSRQPEFFLLYPQVCIQPLFLLKTHF